MRPVTIEDGRVVTHGPERPVPLGSTHYEGCWRSTDPTHANCAYNEVLRLSAALADRDRHFLWDDRLRMERELGDLALRLATVEAERDRLLRFVTEGNALLARFSETRAYGCITVYRMPETRSWFDTPEAAVADWLRPPTPGDTPA